MLTAFSRRLLTVLQLTRMALVFTAIADAQAALLLAEGARIGAGASLWRHLRPDVAAVMAIISVGLYGFGMSLNDIIDRRRDRQIAAHRPLPSGRVGLISAHLICIVLAGIAIGGGLLLLHWDQGWGGSGRAAMALVAVTLCCISYYDFAGKYLVGPGLLALGLVRFFHALIPAAAPAWPYAAVLWHPLWLLNHVVILSTICYRWEEKRPSLTRRQGWGVMAALAGIDALVIGIVGGRGPGTFLQNLDLRPGLMLPLLAGAGFAVVAWILRRRGPTPRQAGQKTMLYGLLWLILYDACFVAAYVDWSAALALFTLLPIAWAAVQLMRWWSKLSAVSHRPDFKRAGT